MTRGSGGMAVEGEQDSADVQEGGSCKEQP